MSTMQDPRDLILVVARSALSPMNVHVLETRHVTFGTVEVYFRIIGESHWITVTEGCTPLLHEVLACVPLPRAACSFHHSFRHIQTCSYEDQQYSVNVRCVPITEEVAVRGTAGEHLQVDFPHPFGAAPHPFTRVWWHVIDGDLVWGTVHVYPCSENIIAVLSESRYQPRLQKVWRRSNLLYSLTLGKGSKPPWSCG